ncbi:MAG TPA: ABC transporter substrate-binding protein [Acidobacteriota bacterium]|nr:ABC transporter substrate-binding protein [Acidobacteriota bacterium]
MKAFLFFLTLALAIFTVSCQEEVKVYRIGAVIPLSGSAEAYGRNVEHGLKLALEQINEKGGVKGKKLDIFIEDDRSDEKVAVQKVNQLIKGSGVPIIIGGVTSNIALAMAPVCEKNKVVLLSSTATSPKLTGIGQYFFRNYPSDTLEGQVMAQYAIRRMRIRSVATLYIDAEYGQGITKVFHDRFQELGGTVSYEKAYPAGTQDFSGYIKEIKAAAPDGIYLPGYYTEIAAILNEIKKQKLQAKIMSVQGMATPMMLEIAGEAAEGVVYPQPPFDPESDNPNIKAFVSAFRSKFPTKPDVDAAFSYDALHIVARAIENSVNYPEDLRARIADTNYRGITGDVTFTTGGDVDIRPRMFQVKGGQFVPLE